jgi:hypothetical protein
MPLPNGFHRRSGFGKKVLGLETRKQSVERCNGHLIAPMQKWRGADCPAVRRAIRKFL